MSPHTNLVDAHVRRHVVDAHLTIPNGTTVTVLFGPSGSGKTTMLRCLAGLEPLDGGHIMMALYEWVSRRRVSARFQEIVTAGFAMALLSFMAFVTYYDLHRAPIFRQMLRQKTVIESPGKGTGTDAPTPLPARP